MTLYRNLGRNPLGGVNFWSLLDFQKNPLAGKCSSPKFSNRAGDRNDFLFFLDGFKLSFILSVFGIIDVTMGSQDQLSPCEKFE